jgi:hypothetical protein
MSAHLKPVEQSQRVFRVMVENVMPLWPQWEPLLKRALQGVETHDPADVRRFVLGEQAQLWIQWNGTLEAFVVSELATYPRGTWLRLWLAATAPGVALRDELFEDVLAEFKDQNECRGFELTGRMGWMRRFPESRFCGIIMRTAA